MIRFSKISLLIWAISFLIAIGYEPAASAKDERFVDYDAEVSYVLGRMADIAAVSPENQEREIEDFLKDMILNVLRFLQEVVPHYRHYGHSKDGIAPYLAHMPNKLKEVIDDVDDPELRLPRSIVGNERTDDSRAPRLKAIINGVFLKHDLRLSYNHKGYGAYAIEKFVFLHNGNPVWGGLESRDFMWLKDDFKKFFDKMGLSVDAIIDGLNDEKTGLKKDSKFVEQIGDLVKKYYVSFTDQERQDLQKEFFSLKSQSSQDVISFGLLHSGPGMIKLAQLFLYYVQSPKLLAAIKNVEETFRRWNFQSLKT